MRPIRIGAVDFGTTQHFNQFIGDIGCGQVRENERIHFTISQLVEGEPFGASLRVEGHVGFHFAFDQQIGVFSLQNLTARLTFLAIEALSVPKFE